jgi:isoleucyl-tRNA synthetase
MDYKSTLNLPQTPFPMRAELLIRQGTILRQWQSQDIYRTILEERRDSRPFIIHDGPPYASGRVHVGIGMNKILKDVIAKYHSMNDRRVPFVPGWDCHGLPVELEILKNLGANASSLGALEIRRLCEMHAQRYVQEQERQFQLLGVFADWDRPYLTMSPSYEAGVMTVLLDLVEKGYVYNGVRPVAWCRVCRTTLAEAEIEYLTRSVPSVWVHFKVNPASTERPGPEPGSGWSFLTWTTSLWSLPGCAALAVHPAYRYAAYAYRDPDGRERVALVCEDLAAPALSAVGASKYEKVAEFEGGSLTEHEVVHPLSGRSIPVVSAELVTKDSGSGVALIAPGHGLDDFAVGLEHRLEIMSPLDEEGRFTAEAGAFRGLGLEEGQEAISASLSQSGSLAAVRREEHDSAHCWRCASPLIVRATRQWFIGLDRKGAAQEQTLREKALVEIQLVQWVPQATRQRIRGMLEARPDWCISRQRVWGVPLPSFVCRRCGESILEPASVRRTRDLIGHHGSRVWFESDEKELLPAGFRCPTCGGEEFDKEGHIVDVWFESGSSWQSVLIADHRLSFPADLYVEGSDQHRGWFQLSLLPALAVRNQSPFRAVLTHGFVLDEKKVRMSRARGQFMTLQEALDKYPADILRLFFILADVSSDISLGPDSFGSVSGFYRTIRNTFRYLLGNLHDFRSQEDSVHLEDLDLLDLWALCRLHRVLAEVNDGYATYELHRAVQHLLKFCNDFLSRLYFRALKDKLYYEPRSSPTRRSAQTVMHSILVALVKLLAPVLPYTCEEVWALTPGRSGCPSVHLSRWPKADEQLLRKTRSLEAEKTFSGWAGLLRAVNRSLERMRRGRQLRSSQDARVRIHLPGGPKEFLGEGTLAELRDFLQVAEVEAADTAEGMKPVGAAGGAFYDVALSEHPVCARCRRRDRTRGSDVAHAEVCARCAEALRPRPPAALSASSVGGPVSPQMRPAELAKFLRAVDVRKVALLNEGGRYRAYALHSPSQEVRPQDGLQILADYVANSGDVRDHAAVLLGLGEHTDVLFGIGLHHLNYGTPLGGTRESAYESVREMLDNLLRLSWGMSVKNAAAELPHGGGKSIIDTCGRDLNVHREFRREIYRDFGQFNSTLFGRYICAEDMGNTTADTREMLYACRHVMCLSQGVSGSGNPSRFTALAAWAAAKAGWKVISGTPSFEGLTLALQGAGNVGRNLVAILAESDPGIKKLLVADRDVEQIEGIRHILIKKGLLGVLEVVSSKDPAAPQSLSYVEREDERGKPYVLYAPCDILIPAAVGNVINDENVGMLGCRLILPVANNVYSDNDRVAAAIHGRGIVDVVENNINWGGALAAASELFGYDEDNVIAACLEAYRKTLDILGEARGRGCPPWAVLKDRTLARIFEGQHPVIERARGYKFIGNINEGFADWIKQKWLRNIVDVDPDMFAPYALGKAEGVIN